MTRMTGPDCVVMCNLINTHTHIHTQTHSHYTINKPLFELNVNYHTHMYGSTASDICYVCIEHIVNKFEPIGHFRLSVSCFVLIFL